MQKLLARSDRLNRLIRRADSSLGSALRAIDDDPFTFCDPACGCDVHARPQP
jgi:hypothetical protein